MSQQVLFGDNTTAPQESAGASHSRRGTAGQRLVLVDLALRGFDAAEINGKDADIVFRINGIWRELQVKSSVGCGPFGEHERGETGHRAGNRTLLSYKDKIDAFAFVSLPPRLVYYVHIDAIFTPTLPEIRPFTRQACDMSFDEMMKRWKT
jgi:hypothetical protein